MLMLLLRFAFAFMHIVNFRFLMFDTLNAPSFAYLWKQTLRMNGQSGENDDGTEKKHEIKHARILLIHSFSGQSREFRVSIGRPTVIRCVYEIKWKLKVGEWYHGW